MTGTERTVTYSSAFKKDLKRESKGTYRKTLGDDLDAALDLLKTDAELPAKYKDHALKGAYKGCRDLHVHPDLVLIYEKEDGQELHIVRLIRLGSHAELF